MISPSGGNTMRFPWKPSRSSPIRFGSASAIAKPQREHRALAAKTRHIRQRDRDDVARRGLLGVNDTDADRFERSKEVRVVDPRRECGEQDRHTERRDSFTGETRPHCGRSIGGFLAARRPTHSPGREGRAKSPGATGVRGRATSPALPV